MGYKDQRTEVENAVKPGIEKNAGQHHDSAQAALRITANRKFRPVPGQQLNS